MGQPGIVEADLAPEGWVRVQGERWRARADAPTLPPAAAVTVEAVEGLSLRVRKGA